MTKKIKIITLCNAGKERSRMLASSLEQILKDDLGKEVDVQVLARGTFGLGSDDKGVKTKYGWQPPEGFVNLLKKDGYNLHSYSSAMISKKEADEANYIIAVDEVIADRVRAAYPDSAKKVIVALKNIDPSENPFEDYLGSSIPDAWGGHLSKSVRDLLHSTDDPEKRRRGLAEIVGALDEETQKAVDEFTKIYKNGNVEPTDIKKIPAVLRDYFGHKIDSDPAYLEARDNLHRVAEGVHRKIKSSGGYKA